MTHYRMLDRAPSVMITSNRNELKLYQNNIVYLNDGDNFELRFFNPLQEKIGVEIMFNGIKKGDSYLVLNPGQDVILDRFLDEQKKMLFETYVVNGNSQEAIEAIQKNGIITFNFYKEFYRNYSNQNEINVNYNFPPKRKKTRSSSSSTYYSKGIVGNNGMSGLNGGNGTTSTLGTNNVTLGSNMFQTFTSQNSNSRSYGSPGVFTTESDISYVASAGAATCSFDSLYEEEDLETGRIEMGANSTQTLKTVNAQFASTPFHTVNYQLLPHSAMNRTIGEVRQYCTCCGYRIRKESWTFCPKCGSELE